MKFKKKEFFKDYTPKEFVTCHHARFKITPYSDETLSINIEDYFFGPESLRETAILFLQLADALAERRKEKNINE